MGSGRCQSKREQEILERRLADAEKYGQLVVLLYRKIETLYSIVFSVRGNPAGFYHEKWQEYGHWQLSIEPDLNQA
jgi:hypothetical protein